MRVATLPTEGLTGPITGTAETYNQKHTEGVAAGRLVLLSRRLLPFGKGSRSSGGERQSGPYYRRIWRQSTSLFGEICAN